MLRSVVCGKAMFCALPLQIAIKFATCVFASTVGAKAFDLHTVLCEHPGCKVLVGLESFILGMQEFDVREMRVVVCESNVVPSAANGIQWWQPPDVGVNLFSKRLCQHPLTLFLDGLPSCFSILTWFTIDWMSVVNEWNALYCLETNKGANAVCHHMSQSMVQRPDVDYFISRRIGSTHVLDSIKSIIVCWDRSCGGTTPKVEGELA